MVGLGSLISYACWNLRFRFGKIMEVRGVLGVTGGVGVKWDVVGLWLSLRLVGVVVFAASTL